MPSLLLGAALLPLLLAVLVPLLLAGPATWARSFTNMAPHRRGWFISISPRLHSPEKPLKVYSGSARDFSEMTLP